MVNHILEQAMRNLASDIHLEPFEDGCKFRLRIDGVLHELPSPSKAVFIMILSRLKVLAKMDIAEKRIPQDGAIALRTGDKRVDLRVSTVPTVYGEKMVMRILDKGVIPLDLIELGIDERQTTDLIESIHSPYGLGLVTGPTGSGKSTTLYACLNMLNEPKVNICTVEDPVEYKFKGLNQVQVKPQVGLTFASALRALPAAGPRHHHGRRGPRPGDRRDLPSAALTGHLVLSTHPHQRRVSAVNRLGTWASSRSCWRHAPGPRGPAAGAPTLSPMQGAYEVDDRAGRTSRSDPRRGHLSPQGLPQCRRVGYRGRVGVFEIIRVTPDSPSLIQKACRSTSSQGAREEGMKMLYDSALDKVRQGLTSLEVALSVTMAEVE